VFFLFSLGLPLPTGALVSKITKADPLRRMQAVTRGEYVQFCQSHDSIVVDGVRMPLNRNRVTVTQTEPTSSRGPYQPETTTVWSFPDRGEWATHRGDYRGNWSPYIPRNLILKYTKPGESVLDPMVGSGTSMVECRLLGRDGIGVDINEDAVMLSHDRLNFSINEKLEGHLSSPCQIKLFVGDARNLDSIGDNSVDLVLTHPPYAGIIRYTGSRVDGDLSGLSFGNFLRGMDQVAKECMRVLRPGHHCGILIGDSRRHQHYVPIAMRVMERFLSAGFALKEDIIKLQYNTKGTRESWSGKKYGFYLIAHEHLFVFRKLVDGERLADYAGSVAWKEP
jgi:DNA modification methylase